MKLLRKKEQIELLKRIAACHIIAKNVIDRLHTTTEMSVEEYAHCVESLTDNTVKSASLIAGFYGLGFVEQALKSKLINGWRITNESNRKRS